jgi:hypothetical protein
MALVIVMRLVAAGNYSIMPTCSKRHLAGSHTQGDVSILDSVTWSNLAAVNANRWAFCLCGHALVEIPEPEVESVANR